MTPRKRSVAALLLAVLASAGLAWAEPAFGRDYYVAGKPGAGAGTQEDPFGMADLPGPDGKLSRALSVLQPGDTLWFRGGEYRCRTAKGAYYMGYIRPPRSGEPGKPISFRAAPAEQVVLVTAEGGQPLLGANDGRPLDHVRFEGFVVHGSIGWISGRGVEIAYCEVIGQFVDTADNHDGIRVEGADGAWIHHSIVRGVRGRSGNSCGIKIYKSRNLIVEDTYIYDNTRGIFDKDSGTNNTYRRNLVTRNDCGFHGNNQGTYMVAHLYDNVIDGGVALGYLTDGADVHDNLIRGDALAGHWAGELWNTHLWNNIVIAAGKEVVAYNESKNAFIREGERRHLRYMDHNLYTAPPKYTFGGKTLTLDDMRKEGFEKNSKVVSGPREIFADEKAYRLLPQWKAAGRNGDPPGPDDVAGILDVTRYGPDARGLKTILGVK